MNMRTMIGKLFVGFALVAGVSLASGEVVEEETWYNAEGQVVKTVKRTLTGADARKDTSWEPAWVVRERQRSSRQGRYYSGNSWRSGSGYGYGYGSSWGTGYYGRSVGYCSPRYRSSGYRAGYSGCRGSGITGFYRGGSGGSSWGVVIRSRGLSGGYRR